MPEKIFLSINGEKSPGKSLVMRPAYNFAIQTIFSETLLSLVYSFEIYYIIK
jgi:hypothetical protein